MAEQGDQRDPPEQWFTGPTDDRFRYSVGSPAPLAGGQGFVFHAQQTDAVQRPIALKLIGDVDEDLERQLRRSWDLVADSAHARLVAPVETFRGPGLFRGPGQPPAADCDLLYHAAHWVSGASLRGCAPLAVGAAADAVADIAQALMHLHAECGLVHRDVHPGNVIIDPAGRGTLIDLGAAHPDDGTYPATVSGVLGFIPPEGTHGPGDKRSDAWALGMVAAYALLGHPIGRSSHEQLTTELARALPAGADHHAVASLLSAMSAGDPRRRPTDLVAWALELGQALRSESFGPTRRRFVGPASWVRASRRGAGVMPRRARGRRKGGAEMTARASAPAGSARLRSSTCWGAG